VAPLSTSGAFAAQSKIALKKTVSTARIPTFANLLRRVVLLEHWKLRQLLCPFLRRSKARRSSQSKIHRQVVNKPN
jgi:hypothetical protein